MFENTSHPGLFLKEELDKLGVTPAEFARQIDVPASRVLAIIRGNRSITADTALRFGHWFGTAARFWTNLQAQFNIATADKQIGSEVRKLPTNPRMPTLIKDDPLISE